MSEKLYSFLLSSLLIFSATSAQSASIIRKYTYYPVTGMTAEQLDKSISRNGPQLGNGEDRHPGATQIRFEADIRYQQTGKYCRIESANATVHATVSLPKWKNRRKADIDTILVWDALLHDIRRHEESHIIIARAHASELEQQARKLYSRSDCDKLRADINKLSKSIFAKHDTAQQRFDRIETMNFEKRFENLLLTRLSEYYDK